MVITAGWSSPVARWAHNPKVAGSNPAPATNLNRCYYTLSDYSKTVLVVFPLSGRNPKVAGRGEKIYPIPFFK
mgnify:CR=1 FL=1